MKERESRTSEDLQTQLSEQLRFLATSANLYDSGSIAEAKRMAVTLRILLHDTFKSTSLLSSLGLKASQFLDTANEDISNVNTGYCGLAQQALGTGKPQYVALLDDAKGNMTDFESWWNRPVLKDMEGHSLSRRDIVLTMADQDGGAHVDPTIDRPYLRIKTGESIGHMWSDGKSWMKMKDATLCSVRQISHEVLKSLVPDYSKKPDLPNGTITFGGFRLIYADSPSDPKKNGHIEKVGRNEACPCGSAKKYKRCHGA